MRRTVFFLSLSLSLFCRLGSAQQTSAECAMPAFTSIVNDPNIFNEEQETWLGEILDPQIRKHFHTINDPEGDYLEKLTQRLLSQLPATRLRYSVTIIDFPGNDAFGFAGGHIYISRRVIAMARDEDELAGILAHEIGHIVTHQSAIDISREFKAVLGVTQVTDRKDILEKWNRLLDNAATSKETSTAKRERQEQMIADRMGLYAMSRAGYAPVRFSSFFDRLAQTKGNTGNFWSDLFGSTSQESRRLREMVRNAAPPPASCVTALPSDYNGRFVQWQKKVAAAGFAVPREELRGLRLKVDLSPPFHSEFRQVRFSPDGRYLLAQDESSVFLLTRDPLENMFRVDAPDAAMARFSPDSHSFVFVDKELRVEKWNLESKSRTSVNQVTLPVDCDLQELSPTGDILACLSPGPELRLIDVATNEVFLNRKNLPQSPAMTGVLGGFLAEFGIDLTRFTLQFSPDGAYLAVGSTGTPMAFDLKTRSEMKLVKDLKAVMGRYFTFKGNSELYGFSDDGKRQLFHLRFPSGEKLDSFTLASQGALVAATQGDYLLLMHAGSVAVGLVNLKEKKISTGYKLDGFDVFGDVFAAETNGGAVAVVTLATGKNVGFVRLPQSPLQPPQASTFSPNGKWLAVTGKNRAAIWNLSNGTRAALLQDFDGASFEDDQFIALFPKKDSEPRRIMQLNMVSGSMQKLNELKEPDPALGIPANIEVSKYLEATVTGSITHQNGDVLITLSPREKASGGGLRLKVNDVRTNKELWQQDFKRGFPQLYSSDSSATVTTVLPSEYVDTHDDPGLKARLDAVPGKGEKKHAYVARTADAHSGATLGTVVIDTGGGSFRIKYLDSTRDTLLVRDSQERTLVFSLQSGKQTGRFFGKVLAVNRAGDRILLETGRNDAELIDLKSLQPVARYTFSAPAVLADFTGDGHTLLVLTSLQTVYQLQLP